MKKIVIAHGHTSIEVLHSMTPLIILSQMTKEWHWKFINYKFSNIHQCEGDLLILIRKYHDGKTSNEGIINELKKLKKNFSKIVYFDDSAAASVIFFCAFPYVDEYWKRSILNNLDLYYKKYYGGHVYSHYYYEKYSIDDKSNIFYNSVADEKTDFRKLKIAWNIGIGIFPLNKFDIFDNFYPSMRRIFTSTVLLPSVYPLYKIIKFYMDRLKKNLKKKVNFNNKLKKFSSRFEYNNYRYSIGFQRELILNQIKNKKFCLTKKKNKRFFTKETFKVFGVLSPFGWGEICYRDFEASIGGAYLVKPDMSHINTWPNIYSKDLYHSLDWDFSNLDSLELLFDKKNNCEESVNLTREKYLTALDTSVYRCLDMIKNLL